MDPMADPSATEPATDPNAAAPMDDPGAMPEAGDDQMAGGDEVPMSDQEESSDSTMDIISKLSPTDREAVRAYAESMLSRDENDGGTEMPGQEEAPGGAGMQEPMMEITKGRLTRVQKRLNEMFGDMLSDKDETERKQKKVNVRPGNFKSPFDSPLD